MSQASAVPIGRSRLWTRSVHVDARLAITLIVAAAAALRFCLLTHNSLWDDEAYVVWMTRFGWGDIFRTLAADDAHPPLYYLLMKAWTSVAGTSEIALRFPSVCFSLASVVLTYVLARRLLQEQGALLAATIVALAPFQVMAGQEARMYPLLGMIVLGSTIALMAARNRGGVVRWGAYTLLAAALVYTQYIGFLVLLSHGVWIIASSNRRQVLAWLVATMGVVLLYAPWWPSMFAQANHTREIVRATGGATLHLGAMIGLIAFGGSVFGMPGYWTRGTLSVLGQVIVILPFLAVVSLGATAMRGRNALIGLIPICVIAAAMVTSAIMPAMYARVFSFLVPFYAVFASGGILEISRKFQRSDRAVVLITIGVLALGGAVLMRYYFEPGFRPYLWRAAANAVKPYVQAGDLFMYVGRSAENSFTYYFRQPHPSLTWPTEPDQPASPFTLDDARQIAHRYRRVWVIMMYPPPTSRTRIVQQQVLSGMRSSFRISGADAFSGVRVDFFSR